MNATSKEEPLSWFAVPIAHVIKRLRTDQHAGLGSGEVSERLKKYGPNRLPTAGKRSPLMRFLMQINNVLIYVLIAAGVGKLLLGEWLDAFVILGVVIINALLGFIQEGKAEKALDSIRNMLSAEAMTVREGNTRMIPAEELVPGDVVLLQSGDKVPADIRLCEVKNLRVEEAPLTGESVPVDKIEDPVDLKAQIGDRKSMAYSGTLVVSGRAKGIVVTTGGNTELGHINQMLSGVQAMETPLLRQIEKFGKVLTILILIVCAITFAYGRLFLDIGFVDMFKAAVGVAVSAIPEGLPAIVTITLAIGVQRMARRHAIIRRLPAVETLGSVSRICSDKTGTLTRNEMVVSAVATADSSYEVTGEGYAPRGEILKDGKPVAKNSVLETMARASVLCNESSIHEEGGVWKLTGDPTEGALLPFAAKVGLSAEAEQAAFPRTNMIPFESEHKFMATLHDSILFVKGAPDVIINYCNCQELSDGTQAPLDRKFWEKKNEEIASKGQRVLALACLKDGKIDEVNLTPEGLTRELVLLGLVGIIDPPRDEAVAAVKECHQGGIRVTMITGDHAVTAASIAKMLGIGDGKSYVTGRQIEEIDDDALEAKCRRIDVFARTSPEHKLRLVRAMQASGQVVSMTGDGVNDAPALKQADVGVAMGIKGTEVSKEAAEMVLTDDNFASITAAVREGRTVYNNIEKAILFMLPTNGGQALTILAAIFLGRVLPVTPTQILWINMVTSVTLALAISFEPHERDVMWRPPRRANEPLINQFGIWRIVFISVLLLVFTFGTFNWLSHHGASVELARTGAVNALILGQVFYLVNSRFLFESCLSIRALVGNPLIPAAIAGVVVLQALFNYAPFMQQIFGSESLPLWIWKWLLLGGVVFFIIVELEKILVRLVYPQVRSETADGEGVAFAKAS
jgi:magnesium-transporting ATPase (P-type)